MTVPAILTRQTPSVSSRNYESWRLAVRPLLPQLPGRRSAAVRPWRHRHRRRDPAVVPDMRTRLCQARRRRRPRPGDKWPVDEGAHQPWGRHALGRAGDQDGHGRDLVHSRRHTKAAQQGFRTWLNGLTDVPRVIITEPWQRSAPRRERAGLGWNLANTAI